MWIGLNLTDRSKLAFRSSNSTWTEGFNWFTYTDWNIFAKLDNAGGNENCGFIKYRHDCTLDNFIQISIQDARCDIQMPFACRLKKAQPTTAPATTTEIKKIVAETSTTLATTTMGTTKKARETCMV
uniref:C-type lectin domain-containing protein n=1 Tax=Panagrolaimus sp. PS1159 TaxID=55785 RepID=A0AC35GT29_9BILA